MEWKKVDVVWIGVILLIAGLFLIIFSRGMFSPIICGIVGVIATMVGIFDVVVGVVTKTFDTPIRRVRR